MVPPKLTSWMASLSVQPISPGSRSIVICSNRPHLSICNKKTSTQNITIRTFNITIIVTITITLALLRSLSGSVVEWNIRARSGISHCHADHTTPGPQCDVDCQWISLSTSYHRQNSTLLPTLTGWSLSYIITMPKDTNAHTGTTMTAICITRS